MFYNCIPISKAFRIIIIYNRHYDLEISIIAFWQFQCILSSDNVLLFL